MSDATDYPHGPRALAAWQALAAEYDQIGGAHMRALFDADPTRAQRLSLEVGPLFMDYSKHRIREQTLGLLVQLAHDCGVAELRDAMFRGDAINLTEARAVQHTALRIPSTPSTDASAPSRPESLEPMLAAIREISEGVRAGTRTGHTGEVITDVVHIGIGGSELGPAMVVEALADFADGPRIHFVSNVDPADLADALAGCTAATTLFIVVSKSFTTQETMANAQAARAWFLGQGATQADVQRHFLAVTNNDAAAREFGIADSGVLFMWKTVGGRYSLWSTVGLSIAMAIGYERFTELLAGAHAIDEHFRTAPFERNAPVISAMLGVWYNTFFGAQSHAVLPYAKRLHRLPAYLQQTDMESNGKSVSRAGQPANWQTGPIVWGAPGTNGQHAFFQLLHQGTKLVPSDFIVCARPNCASVTEIDQHQILLANCLAQTEALMRGKTEQEARAELEGKGLSPEQVDALAPHKVFAGNRPSTTLLFEQLDAHSLGALLAFYEHRIFVMGAVYDINSFDQWGVELGKQLAKVIAPELAAEGEPGEHDGSTAQLIARVRAARASG